MFDIDDLQRKGADGGLVRYLRMYNASRSSGHYVDMTDSIYMSLGPLKAYLEDDITHICALCQVIFPSMSLEADMLKSAKAYYEASQAQIAAFLEKPVEENGDFAYAYEKAVYEHDGYILSKINEMLESRFTSTSPNEEDA